MLCLCAAVVVISLLFIPVVVIAGLVQPLGSQTVADIPPASLEAYQQAAAHCPGLPWPVLAGIGKVETDHGRSPLPGVTSGANPFGAEGPMQFLPATFAAYGIDSGDGDAPSPYDLADATLAAARMLCANGAATPGGLRAAVWAYNHSETYVDEVVAWAERYASTSASPASEQSGA